MVTHFKGYRIASTRWSSWDYGRPAWYFVTICTRQRARSLACIRGGALEYTVTGRLAAECWERIRTLHPGVRLAEWVVMPDHLHGLIRPAGALTLESGAGPGQPSPPRWRAQTLGVLINQFKRAVTLEARRQGIPWLGWQPRFHDRIVRDATAFHAIRRYILMNPVRYLRAHGVCDRRGPPDHDSE
jgi:REP element-mobilizing transposase RayT